MNNRRGFTLAELMVAMSVTSVLLLSTMAVLSNTARSLARSQTTTDTTRQARQGMEASLSLIRSASEVLPVAIVHGVQYQTDSRTLVLSAPAYNLDIPSGFPTGENDLVVIQWDPVAKTLLHSVHRAIQSKRPQSNRRIIARGVETVSWTFRVCDSYNWVRPSTAGSTTTFRLNTTPSGTIDCRVNGVSRAATLLDARTVSIATPATSTARISFLYPSNPESRATTNASKISSVGLKLVVSDRNANGENTSFTLDGLARLRNHRL